MGEEGYEGRAQNLVFLGRSRDGDLGSPGEREDLGKIRLGITLVQYTSKEES